MITDDDHYNQKKSVSINKFFEFNNLVVEFENRVENCIKDHIEFWKELVETSIDIQKLEKYGTAIISEKEETA